MAQLEASLTTVEEWHKKSLALVGKSNDALLTLITKAFETIAVVLSQEFDNDRVVRSIASLDFERTLALQFESKDFDVLRHLVFGLIESLQVLLPHLRREKSGVNEQLSSDEASNLAPSPLLTVKEEPAKDAVETTQVIPHDNQLPTLDFGDDMDFKEEDMKFEPDYVEPIVEESLNDLSNREYSDIRDLNAMEDNSVNDFAIDADDVDGAASSELNGEDGEDLSSDDLIGEEKEKTVVNTRKESSESVDETNRRRSSRNVLKPPKYNESLDYSDEDVGAQSKKAKVDSSKRIENKRSSQRADCHSNSEKLSTKINDTELKCPISECEYRSMSVPAWYAHLKRKHNTTPALAGVALLCACGDESASFQHSLNCSISKITVIRKRDGPIRRSETTPQCIFCEMHPKTMHGYALHLQTYHKSSLLANDIFLTCSCGFVARSRRIDPNHSKNCDAREFSVHKLDEK